MKKILVLGASGLTGSKVAKIATKKYQVFASFNSRPLELEEYSALKVNLNENGDYNKIEEINPDIIINTAALHNVDFCESNHDEADAVNTRAVEKLFSLSNKLGCKLVHISTDYVFDGSSTTPYTENDSPIPINYYGISKLNGEKILSNSNYVVIRPSVVYGWTPLELAGTVSSSGKPMNFAMWLLTKLHTGENLKIVTDQFASATLADSLAESALKIAESEKGGLYHVAGISCESRFEFSQKLAKEFGYDTNQIQPTDSSKFKQKAKRPSYSCLDSSKALKEFDLNLYTTEDALKIMKNQVEKEAPHLLGNSS